MSVYPYFPEHVSGGQGLCLKRHDSNRVQEYLIVIQKDARYSFLHFLLKNMLFIFSDSIVFV